VRYQIRTPDALQLAAAISAEADAFLTNDHALKRVKEITVLVMDDISA
jgi:predicted nucleic acid-binding protein